MTPQMESDLGKAMLKLALSEGHRKRHPINPKAGPSGVTAAALRALAILAAEGEIRGARELARRVDASSNSVTQLMVRLETRGWVEIERPNSNRVRVYRITDAGKAEAARWGDSA